MITLNLKKYALVRKAESVKQKISFRCEAVIALLKNSSGLTHNKQDFQTNLIKKFYLDFGALLGNLVLVFHLSMINTVNKLIANMKELQFLIIILNLKAHIGGLSLCICTICSE